MKTSYLTSLWDTPDNSRLTAKQFSLRLPVHVSAKIAALCEMYPNKNRTQIIGDLLSSALEELEQSLPMQAGGSALTETDEGFPMHEDVGPRGRFRKLANKHYQALEMELGNDHAPPLYEPILVVDDDVNRTP